MKLRHILSDTALILGGAALFSVGVNMFSVPNGIVQGGLTGVSTMLNHLFPVIPIGLSVFVLNVPLFIISFMRLGKAFVLKTLGATAVFSVLIDAGAAFIPPYRGDVLLAALFCGVLSGAGLGAVLLAGATTGGTETAALLVRQKKPHSSVGSIMLVFDLVVITLSWAVFGKLENVMYAAVTLFVSSKTIDLVLYGAGHSKLVFIVTEKGEMLTGKITGLLKRGVTSVPVTGGYTGKKKTLLLCAVRASEAALLSRITKEADPQAFTVITEAGEVLGRGFT
mgnify:CR=1 FL=1